MVFLTKLFIHQFTDDLRVVVSIFLIIKRFFRFIFALFEASALVLDMYIIQIYFPL